MWWEDSLLLQSTGTGAKWFSDPMGLVWSSLTLNTRFSFQAGHPNLAIVLHSTTPHSNADFDTAAVWHFEDALRVTKATEHHAVSLTLWIPVHDGQSSLTPHSACRTSPCWLQKAAGRINIDATKKWGQTSKCETAGYFRLIVQIPSWWLSLLSHRGLF